MKHSYLLRFILSSLLSMPLFLSAQCPVVVNAGEDVYVCNTPQQITLNAEIDGPYVSYQWATASGTVLPAGLSQTVSVSQTTSYIFSAKSFDPANNLIVNGDFEQGNTGFSSDLEYSPGDLSEPGTYDVLSNPQFANPNFEPCGDHTSGSGNMLVASYPMFAWDLQMWCQTVEVTPNTDYYFSFWATRVVTSKSPVTLSINGFDIPPPLVPQQSTCNWVNKNGIWNSGNNTSAHICFRKQYTLPSVLVIDDIFFTPVCQATDTVTVTVVNVQAKASPPLSFIDCEGVNLTLSGAGSTVDPAVTYNWSTPNGNIVSGQNTLNPVVNASGTYTLTVSLENGIGDCEKTATVEVWNSNQPQVTITSPQTLTCISNAVLTGHSSQAATSTYQWTADQGGNIVSGANNPTAIVDEPGTYTLLVTNTVTGCTAESSIFIAAPELPAITLQPPGFLCDINDTLTLSATVTPAAAVPSWTTPDGQIVAGANTLNPQITVPGTYVLTVANPANGCTAEASVVVYRQDCCPVSVSAGEDLYLCGGPQQVQLNAEVDGEYVMYGWPDSWGTLSNTLSKIVNVNQTTSYVFTAFGINWTDNLIVNGDFEQGNTGFSSDLEYSPGYLWEPGTYDVLSNPESANSNFEPCEDHTSGNGNMLVANFQAGTGNRLWCQTVDVIPNVDYYYSYWATRISWTKPDVILSINDVVISGLVLPPQQLCSWVNSNGIWHNDGDWTAKICFKTIHPTPSTPSIDDIFFAPVCTVTDTVTVHVVDVQAEAYPPVSFIDCEGANLILDGTGSTTGPNTTYAWETPDGNIVSGTNTSTSTVSQPGLYILLVTNTTAGCTATDTIVVMADTSFLPVNILAADTITCILSDVTLSTDSATSGVHRIYAWTALTGGNIVSGGESLAPVVDAPGLYALLVSDTLSGCLGMDTVAVVADVEAPEIALVASGTLNCQNESVTLLNSAAGGSGPLNHVWTLPDGSSTGTGSVAELNVSQPGDYSLMVTNTQNGCTNTAGAIVAQHGEVTVNLVTQQNVSCFGAADGALGATAGGGDGVYAWQWSNGAGTPSLENLGAGVYAVTVSDAENCTATLEVTVAQPAELLAGATATPVSSAGASDGTAAANPQGGTLPYSFNWNTGATTSTLENLSAGMYTVTVTDANSCTAEQSVEVLDGPCSLIAEIQAANPLCHGAADGQATVIPAGGTAPYAYIWTSGSTEQTAKGLTAGTYGVTVTDVNGCPFSGTVSLDDPPLLTLVTENAVHTVCPASAEGSATVLAFGGTGVVGIVWSNGQQGPSAAGLSAGTYTATATDANGCTATATIVVEAVDAQAPVIQAGAATVALGMTGSVTLTLQLLSASVTDNCAVAGAQIVPETFDCFDLGEQQVNISALDDSGNSAVQTVMVTIVDLLAPELECPPAITRCFDENVVEYTAPVAFDNCLVLGGTFDQVSGLPSGASFPQGTTANTFTFTDMQGNAGFCSFEVTILSPLAISLDTVIHDIDNQGIGGIQVTVGGSMPGYTFVWKKNGEAVGTEEDLGGIGAGLYTLEVTDAFGCKTEAGPFEVTSLVHTGSPNAVGYIAVFPNPSGGAVHVVLPDELLESEVFLAVFDATGRRVLEQQSSRQKQSTLDLSPFAGGLYSILIQTGEGQAVRTIFVVR